MCDVDIAAKSTKISPNLQMFTRLHCSTHLSKRQSFLEELKVERRKSYVQRTTCWPNGIIFSTLPTKLHQTFLDVFSRKIEQKKHANFFTEIFFSTENLIPEKSLLGIFFIQWRSILQFKSNRALACHSIHLISGNSNLYSFPNNLSNGAEK